MSKCLLFINTDETYQVYDLKSDKIGETDEDIEKFSNEIRSYLGNKFLTSVTWFRTDRSRMILCYHDNKEDKVNKILTMICGLRIYGYGSYKYKEHNGPCIFIRYDKDNNLIPFTCRYIDGIFNDFNRYEKHYKQTLIDEKTQSGWNDSIERNEIKNACLLSSLITLVVGIFFFMIRK